MSILDLHDPGPALPRYISPPKVQPEPKFSVWSALTAAPRAVGEAAAQGLASLSELTAAYGDTMARMESGESLTARDPNYQSDFAELLRDRGRSFRPDPQDSHAAEQLIYGFATGATKVVTGAVVGGPAGVVTAGFEEAMSAADDLERQGVTDKATRMQAAGVQGAGLALAALPLVGKTMTQTAALYLAGGPGGFMAQQALTREILQAGGYDQVAAQYDPFDPVGLAVSSLIPAVFTAAGIRSQRKAARVQREVEDAARVALQAEQRRTSNPAPEVPRSADLHEAALVKAEDAIARGEPVQVADVAPRTVITGAEREANFRAWFGDSKVVDDSGAPLVVYHGTGSDFAAFEMARLGDNTRVESGELGFFFTAKRDLANNYADIAARGGWGGKVRKGDQVIYPVFLSIRNPKIYESASGFYRDADSFKGRLNEWRAELQSQGFDGVVVRSDFEEVIAFSPEQIKSATGNSGRFDPTSPSLTDPITQLGAAVDQLRAAMDEVSGRTEPPAVAKPEPAAPVARGLPSDVVELRKHRAVLAKLLECLNE